MQLGLLGVHFSSETTDSHRHITQILTQFLNGCPITRNPIPLFSKTVKQLTLWKTAWSVYSRSTQPVTQTTFCPRRHL